MTATATATVNTKGLVGQIIGDGRYDLRELLGGGSMGYVYRAFDRRLETDVVVKIPRRHKLENPDSLRRFRQESKFLVKLNHPHVVSILDVGEYDDTPLAATTPQHHRANLIWCWAKRFLAGSSTENGPSVWRGC